MPRRAGPRDSEFPPKPCVACGRPITWRKKWARDWPDVKYCSDACRRTGTPDDKDRAIDAAILQLLDRRPAGATICPSEVARQLSPDDWRGLMEPVRRAGRRLAAQGEIIWTAQGSRVDPATVRGPVRFKRVHRA